MEKARALGVAVAAAAVVLAPVAALLLRLVRHADLRTSLKDALNLGVVLAGAWYAILHLLIIDRLPDAIPPLVAIVVSMFVLTIATTAVLSLLGRRGLLRSFGAGALITVVTVVPVVFIAEHVTRLLR